MKIDDRVVGGFQFFGALWLFAAIVCGFILIAHYMPAPWSWCAHVFLVLTILGVLVLTATGLSDE